MSRTAKVLEPEVDPLDEVRADPRDTIQPPPTTFDPGFSRNVKRAPADVAEGITFARIYWLYGESPRGCKNSEVKDPPTSGWSSCFVFNGDKPRVTLFCPYTFQSYDVTQNSYEMDGMHGNLDGFPRARFEEMLPRKWAEYTRNSIPADFDTAAKLFKGMGLRVPDISEFDGLVTTPRTPPKGSVAKPPAATLLKPVKRDGRRGEVLQYFLDGHTSIADAMVKFSVTRSNFLSQLFLLRREHGISYTAVGDTAAIELPAGCEDPFSG